MIHFPIYRLRIVENEPLLYYLLKRACVFHSGKQFLSYFKMIRFFRILFERHVGFIFVEFSSYPDYKQRQHYALNRYFDRNIIGCFILNLICDRILVLSRFTGKSYVNMIFFNNYKTSVLCFYSLPGKPIVFKARILPFFYFLTLNKNKKKFICKSILIDNHLISVGKSTIWSLAIKSKNSTIYFDQTIFFFLL